MSSTEEKERFDQARATSHRRAKQFVDAVTPEKNALDDRIEAELARDNASLRSKLGKVYKLVDAASALASPHVACKRGCSACCHMNVSITVVEAERLSAVSGRRFKAVTAPVTHDEAKFSGTPQAGGNTRPTIYSRYRQWLSHKLGTWKQQYGTLGCVGCGRCITWCPAEIDITEEISALRNEVTR